MNNAQAQRLAPLALDGLGGFINPVHTMLDGDTLFALATGQAGQTADMLVLCTLAAEVTARAVVRAVLAAKGISSGGMSWPAATELLRTPGA